MNLRSVRTGFLLERKREREREGGGNIEVIQCTKFIQDLSLHQIKEIKRKKSLINTKLNGHWSASSKYKSTCTMYILPLLDCYYWISLSSQKWPPSF